MRSIAAYKDAMQTNQGGTVGRFYADRSVLVTGATGFMGKVLVEKLLRASPDLDRVFVLLRPKHGHNPGARLQHLLASPVFDALRSSRSEALAKVTAVGGDVTLRGLGLVHEDRSALVEAVSVVFHVAATVRFNEHLRDAFEVNVGGTRAVLDFCRDLPRLVALVHVSTAYSNCTRHHVEEVVFPPPMSAPELEAAIAGKDDKAVEQDSPRLLGEYPNTYTFTKAIAEAVVVQEGAGLPVAILRPSIVAPAWRQPMVGWVDNANGPVGPWVAIGKGLMTCVFGDEHKVADLVPVDVCINLMLAVAWDVATGTHCRVPVYNCVAGSSKSITWGRSTALWVDTVRQDPFETTLGFPSASFTKSRLYHRLCVVSKVLPAFCLDLLARASGRKPLGVASVILKQRHLMAPLDFFTSNEWSFCTGNMRRLWAQLDAVDREEFPFDVADLDWSEYMKGVLAGAKVFLLKERNCSNQADTRAKLQRSESH